MANSIASQKDPVAGSVESTSLTKISLQDALNVLEDAFERGADDDAARLRDEIMKSLDRAARPQLLKLLYKRGIDCLKDQRTVVADGLLTWLRQCDPVSLKANLAEAAVVQVLEGRKAATDLFREFVMRRPMHRIQAATEPGLMRAGTLMCIGAVDLDFQLGGFTLPGGHSESQHLFAGAEEGNVFVFCDGLTGFELGGFDVLFNAISDPDVFGARLEVLADTSETIVNHPQQCLQNTRNWLSETFANETDFIVPKTVRVAAKSRRADVLAEHDPNFPLLMRPVGSQTGDGLVKFDTASEFTKTDYVLEESYLTEFHDFGSDDSFYRKFRCWWIGGTVVPNHLFVHTHWKVHSAASRLETMDGRPALQAEEKEFLADAKSPRREQVDHMMHAIAEANGLDYFGVDFSFLPSGQIVVFEANATMRSHYPEYSDTYPYLQKPATAHVAAFQKLVRAKAGR
ncbi:MAG: hypothetical protein GY948_09085 [Alphaproteobacteria bacterium]|nr:hypothetical protein [Alphaproteobacteria bacterium]